MATVSVLSSTIRPAVRSPTVTPSRFVARADLVLPLHDGIDSAVAAGSLADGTTAWIAQHHLEAVTTTDTVLVLGASVGVGTAAALLALAAGATVIAAVGSVGRGDALRAFGASIVLRRKSSPQKSPASLRGESP